MLFQLPTQHKCTNISTIASENSYECYQIEESNSFIKEILPHHTGKLNCPPLFSDGLVTSQDDNLVKSLKKDLIWSTSDSFRRKNNNNAFEDVGSWTNYQKLVTDYPTHQ